MTIEEFIQIMKKSTQGNQSLFHFTDTRNLPSIRQHGLLSANQRDARGISPITTGGNELSQDADGWNNVRDYVHLCLRRNHPVAYRAKTEGRFIETTFLRINPEILKIPGAMVSLDVANKTGARIMTASELDFVHFSGPDPEDAFVGDEHEGVVQRHGDSAKIVGVFPFASM